MILGTSISCGKDYPVGTTEYNLDFEYAWNDSVPMRWTLRNPSLTGYGCRLDRQELLRYLHPLRTCDPDDADYTELEPLGRVAAASRIVGLGESTHGSDEIFAMKDRIVRYLTSRQGFDLFALEANHPEALRVNDYTIRGEENPKQLIRGMYVWPWMTEKMLALVEWMKGYNASEPRMTFTGGGDLQMPATLMGALQRLLPGTGSAARRAAALAEQLRSIYDAAYRVDVDLARSLEPELDTLAVDPLVASLPAAERAEVEGNIGMLRAFLSQYRDPSWRDRGMASTLEGILQRQDEIIIGDLTACNNKKCSKPSDCKSGICASMRCQSRLERHCM
ncbi:hypothetical protein B5G09_07160 [Alistipes sp. An54]|uniref:erythromycin esterase family protein n=1 Tax=Alistipes sp. An54 TaxID=1965645 RepID=UPI000B36DE94|nr:erythromycin esterase family protein [Alistipes sp. An54]OUN77172.1 hypothetical protein B5G09_07160 [Alistipes sp. An54]